MKDRWSIDFDRVIDWPSTAELNANLAYIEGVGMGEMLIDLMRGIAEPRARVIFTANVRKGYNDFINDTVRNKSMSRAYVFGTRLAHHSRLYKGESMSFFLHGYLMKTQRPKELPSYYHLKIARGPIQIGERFLH